MKVFFENVDENENYVNKKRLADIPDADAYARAYKAYPNNPEWVEYMLDGFGYIYVTGHNCRFIYQQDTL